MPVSLLDVLAKSDALVHRQIADETILVPIRRDVADLECIYALEGVGPRIWELVDGRLTVGNIAARIGEEYEIDPATAEVDVVGFLSELAELGALTRVG